MKFKKPSAKPKSNSSSISSFTPPPQETIIYSNLPMKEALKQISSLVDRFQRNIDAYHNPTYNETQLRIEFVDPFFEALGWDIANKEGHAEQYKDVIHEDAIKIAGATKAPDYCFRIGGARKFFLETKKPSIDILSISSNKIAIPPRGMIELTNICVYRDEADFKSDIPGGD